MTVSYVGGDGNDVSLEVTDAKIWDGGDGGNANWTTGANWNGDTAPTGGETLIFPDSGLQKTNNNDFRRRHELRRSHLHRSRPTSSSGDSIDLDGDVIGTNQQGLNTLNVPLVLSGDSVFSQQQGFVSG